jgi:hypothetical protein
LRTPAATNSLFRGLARASKSRQSPRVRSRTSPEIRHTIPAKPLLRILRDLPSQAVRPCDEQRPHHPHRTSHVVQGDSRVSARLALVRCWWPRRPRSRAGIPSGRVVLDYWEKWTGSEGLALQKVVDRYNQSQGKVWVRRIPVADIVPKTMVAIAGRDPPDLAGLYSFNIPQLAESRAAMSFDEFSSSAAPMGHARHLCTCGLATPHLPGQTVGRCHELLRTGPVLQPHPHERARDRSRLAPAHDLSTRRARGAPHQTRNPMAH